MKTILLLFLSMAAVFAADPAQPKVGQTPVINATNGFGGNLTVRTQLNVGYPNQAGLVQILSTNGTFTGTLSLNDQGTFVLTDDVTDSASAVAFSFNSSNALSTSGAKLATFGNGGANQIIFANQGGIGIGPYAEEYWGPLGNQWVSFSNTAGDGLTSSGFNFTSYADWEGPADQWGFIEGDSNADGSSQFTVKSSRSNSIGRVDISTAGPDAYFDVLIAGQQRVLFWPSIGDGATPHILDTSLAHTYGNLAEIKNNGANAFTLAAVSGYSGAGTLFLSDDGTYKAGGGGATINPTDGRIPYRQDGTTFGNSPWHVLTDTNTLGFNGSSSHFLVYHSGSSGRLGIGNSALAGTTANNNIGIGESAGGANVGGTQNIFIGNNAGSSGGDQAHSVGIGHATLQKGNDGFNNTAVGDSSGSNLTGGIANTFLGASSGISVTNGAGNVLIGNGVDVGADYDNSVGIGNGVLVRGSNVSQIGTNGVTVLYLNGTVGWFRGSGSPEGVVTAPVGSFYSNEAGGVLTSFYVKQSGTGNTGWAAK